MRTYLNLLAGAVLINLISSSTVHSSIVSDGGFESGTPILDPNPVIGSPIPGLGQWFADPAMMVGAENGIVPAGGSSMLRFESGGGSQSNIWQVVTTPSNVRGRSIFFSALFNAPHSSSSAELRIASSDVLLLPGDGFPNPASVSSSSGLDGDPATWELLGLDFGVPANSQSLMFMVAGGPSGSEVMYADSASAHLAAIPEPVSAIVWFCLLIVGTGVYTRVRG